MRVNDVTSIRAVSIFGVFLRKTSLMNPSLGVDQTRECFAMELILHRVCAVGSARHFVYAFGKMSSRVRSYLLEAVDGITIQIHSPPPPAQFQPHSFQTFSVLFPTLTTAFFYRLQLPFNKLTSHFSQKIGYCDFFCLHITNPSSSRSLQYPPPNPLPKHTTATSNTQHIITHSTPISPAKVAHTSVSGLPNHRKSANVSPDT